MDLDARSEQREHLGDVDVRRAKKLLADGAPALREVSAHRAGATTQQHLASQREAVGVHAVAGQTQDYVTNADALPSDGLLAVQHADARAADVEGIAGRGPGERVGVLRELTADDGDARALRTVVQSFADGREEIGVRLLEADAVQERHRLGAGADDVVDVHRDAVHADAFVRPEHLRDDGLGTDAIGGDRDR